MFVLAVFVYFLIYLTECDRPGKRAILLPGINCCWYQYTCWITVEQLAAKSEKMLSWIITVPTLEFLREVGKGNRVCATHTAVIARSSLICTFWGMRFGLLVTEQQDSLLLFLITFGLQSDLEQVTWDFYSALKMTQRYSLWQDDYVWLV